MCRCHLVRLACIYRWHRLLVPVVVPFSFTFTPGSGPFASVTVPCISTSIALISTGVIISILLFYYNGFLENFVGKWLIFKSFVKRLGNGNLCYIDIIALAFDTSCLSYMK
jgi:hypothetical protein